MTASGSLYPWRRAGRLAMVMIIFTTAWAVLGSAQSEDVASPDSTATTAPHALLQFSTLTGSGNTVNATWVPVITAAGTTIYKNITLVFDVDTAGNLTIAPGYPKVVPAPPSIVSNFRAGRYVGPSTVLSGTAILNVSGPGVTSGGATEWALAAASGANIYTYPSSAT